MIILPVRSVASGSEDFFYYRLRNFRPSIAGPFSGKLLLSLDKLSMKFEAFTANVF